MESLRNKYQATLDALNTLNESIDIINMPEFLKIHNTLRDSVIKRFEYSIDIFWKFLKEYIEYKHKIIVDISSPKFVLRTCLNLKILNESEFKIFIEMVDDRNLTSHTYNSSLAEIISQRSEKYYEVMYNILSKINLEE